MEKNMTMTNIDKSSIEFDFEGFDIDREFIKNELTLIKLKKEIEEIYGLNELEIDIKYEPLEEDIRSDIKRESLDLAEDFIESDNENSDPLHISQEDRLMLREVPVNKNWNAKNYESDENIHLKKIRESRFPIVLVKKLAFKVIKDSEGKSVYLTVKGKGNDKLFCRIPSQILKCLNSNESFDEQHSLVSHSFTSQKKFNGHSNSVVSSSKHLGKTDQTTNSGFKCIHCDFKTIDVITLNTHVLSHLESELNCSECDFTAGTKKELENHIQSHSNSKTFQCFECDYKTSIKSNIKTHLLIHYDLKLFNCFQCAFECRTKDDLQLHLLEHSETRVLKCSLCTYESNSKNDLEEHLSSHSNESNLYLNTKLHKCTQCKYFTNNKYSLKLHLRCHSDLKLYECHQCHYKCNMKATLNKHLLWHSRKFKCHMCNYSTENKGNLKSHFVVHCSKKRFNCSKCSYTCKRKFELRSHMLRKHKNSIRQSKISNSKCTNEDSGKDLNKKLFKCAYSKFSYTKKGALMLHQRLYKCLHCNDYKTNSIMCIRSHLKTHSVDGVSPKLYKCPLCNFETDCQNELPNHHHENHPNIYFKFSSCKYLTVENNSISRLLNNFDKLFKCSSCSYETNYKTNLNAHAESHHKRSQNASLEACNKTELFKCDICDYKTEHSKRFKCPHCPYLSECENKFTKHLLIHSKEKLYKCLECTYKTNYKKCLRNHIACRHPSQNSLNILRKLKCYSCDYETDCKEKFNYHYKEFHNNKFECPHCNYWDDEYKTFKRHLLIHSFYRCSYCSYKTKSKKFLRRHVASRPKTSHQVSSVGKIEAKLKCYRCDYAANSEKELKCHRKEHANKMFKCPNCHFVGFKKSSLQLHLSRHSKLFRCSKCRFETHSKCSLGYHILSHFRTMRYRCSICSYSTMAQLLFKSHQLYHCNTIDMDDVTDMVEHDPLQY